MGYEVWVGHIFAVLLALWIERPNAPYVVAAIATILLILEFSLSPPGIPPDMAVFNRTVGIALLWITAGLVARAKTAKLDDATRRLGAIVESSSDAISECDTRRNCDVVECRSGTYVRIYRR